MAKKKKGKAGRRPLWDVLDMPALLDSVEGWAKQGSTDVEMCEMLGISHDTFYKWKREKPEFAEAIKRGKYESNGEILNSAFKQSTGFKYIEQQAIKVKAWEKIDGELVQVERVEVVNIEKFAPPNAIMSIFMLKNRLPGDYKDKQQHEVTGADGGVMQVSFVPAPEMAE